jgi:hypothetical protein
MGAFVFDYFTKKSGYMMSMGAPQCRHTNVGGLDPLALVVSN